MDEIDVDKFELDGKIYVAEVAIVGEGCGRCVMPCLGLCADYACYHQSRKDGRTVIFVEKKEEVQVNKEEKKEDNLYDLINKGIMMFQCGSREYAEKVQNKLFETGTLGLDRVNMYSILTT